MSFQHVISAVKDVLYVIILLTVKNVCKDSLYQEPAHNQNVLNAVRNVQHASDHQIIVRNVQLTLQTLDGNV